MNTLKHPLSNKLHSR